MKSTIKKSAIIGFGVACALTLSVGIGLLTDNGSVTKADENATSTGSNYFYENLNDPNNNEYTLAKSFYEALEEMNGRGDFLDGVVDYSLKDVVTSDQLKGWIEGNNLEVPKAFGAARDAFLTDHPELFYINFYKMTISVAKSSGEYVGYINSGREANLYYDNGFNTEEAVSTAITTFNAEIDKIVKEMNKLEQEDTYSARDAFLAKEVNKYLADNVTYDYVAYDNKDDPNYIAAAYINTAYGGIVEKKAVCGGFSNSYKVIMDRLDIPCITVNGYSNNKDQNGKNSASNVYHMWNYVWLENPSEPEQSTVKKSAARTAQDGRWYSVDVTWNYSAPNKYRYALLTAQRDEDIHVNDGVISSSGYKLAYPELSEWNYGSTDETSGLQASIEYTNDGGIDDFGKPRQKMFVSVSYNGKGAKKLLEEDNLYIAFRNSEYRKNDSTGKLELVWTDWASLEVFRQFAVDHSGIMNKNFIEDNGGPQTRYYDNTSIYYTQFAVFDVKPDREYSNDPKYDSWPKHDPETESYRFFWYSNDVLNNTNAVETGKVLVNKSYGTYAPAPFIQQSGASTVIISDSMRDPKITDKVICAENKAFVFEVTYNEELHVLDETKPIEISFVSDHPNTKDYANFFPVSKDDKGNDVYVELVQRPKNSGDPTLVYNTLRFKFGPSLMYEHDQEGYTFTFSNVGSTKLLPVMTNGVQTGEKMSNKLPNPAYYNFGRDVVACPACFNYDGRLWIECCAAPTLVTQTDLAAMDFKDENGESTFSENERSQMMLVAERANTETVNTILDGIGGIENSNVTKDDIKTSETYDIRLQMCNKYPTIPDGSYVKIGLGFPEGYGPDDEGVTFKLYHRKHIKGDEYIIEEIPCVVTQFGIVATVTSFSPYMVAVVDADKATDKTVYASIEGRGGTLTKEDGKIISFKEGDSHTYTIRPDEGYKIYSVNLNGKNVLDRVDQSGKLTLGYADLDTNNELVIRYIANEAAARIQQKLDNNSIDQAFEVGVSVIDTKGNIAASTSMPSFDIHPDNFVQVKIDNPANGNNVIIIVVAVVCSVVVAAGVAVAIVLLLRKNKKPAKKRR